MVFLISSVTGRDGERGALTNEEDLLLATGLTRIIQ